MSSETMTRFLIILLLALAAGGCGDDRPETVPVDAPDPVFDPLPAPESEEEPTGEPEGDIGSEPELEPIPEPVPQQVPEPAPSPAEPEAEPDEGCGPISFDAVPTEIGEGLPGGYEPSGADWHERLNKLFLVGDGGIVSSMNRDGSGITNWNVGGDIEGITIADPQSDFVYIGVENPDGVREFNIATGNVTRSFDLTPWMVGANNSGLEALTFVRDAANPEGGLFYAGHQGEGAVYVFQLPIASSSSSTTVTFVRSFRPVPGRADLSGMDYDPVTDVIYAIFDGPNRLITMRPNGTVLEDQPLPHNDQEGFARTPSCDLFVAQDTGKKVWYYEGVPPPVVIDEAAAGRLMRRVMEVRNNDGSYGWQRPLAEPLDPAQPGFQNVTGITALGLFDAGDLLQEPDWEEAVDDVAGYLEGRLDLLLADPADVSLNLSCPNWTFFASYLERFPDPALREKVIQGLSDLLDARDVAFGGDDSMRVDGLFNRIILGRAAIPGIIPWDLALCVEGLGATARLEGVFETDYEDSLALLAQRIESSFLPAYDADPLLLYADISLSMPIFVMEDSPSADSFVPTVSALRARLAALVRPDGSVTNGSDNDGPQQASVYALLAFKILRDPAAQPVQDYLQGQIDADGIIADPVAQIETFEVEGEALRALVYTPD